MSLRKLYLALAVAGTIVPFWFLTVFFIEAGLDLRAFLAAVFANGATSGFAVDLVISSVAFWFAMFALERRDGGPKPWGFVAVNLCVGLSAALPLYLYVRECRRSSA